MVGDYMSFSPYPYPATQAPATPFQASGYGRALGSFGGYRGSMDGLSAPFYPMLYGAFSQLLPQMGIDPYGDAVRRAGQGGEQLSLAEQARQRYDERQALRAELDRQSAEQRAAAKAKQDAWTGSDEYKKWLGGMTPDNRRVWGLMSRM